MMFIFACSCKECSAVSFYFILFYLFFHLKSFVTIAPLKQLIASLRMEEQFIRNVTPAKYFFYL